MTPFLDPTVDYVFKIIFGSAGNEDVLISLVNSILSEEDQVKSITVLNPINLKEFDSDKLSELDIKAVCHNGNRLNIEIQVRGGTYYGQRSLYYWARTHAEQLQEKGQYRTLCKTIGIHIFTGFSFDDEERYHSVYIIKNKLTNKTCEKLKHLEMHYIDLDKFDKTHEIDIDNPIASFKNVLDKWATFFTHYDLILESSKHIKIEDDPMQKAIHALEVMSYDPRSRADYQARQKQIRDYNAYLDEQVSLAEEKGKELGKEEGREEGKRVEKMEIAKTMLADGISKDLISKFTGLSIFEIEKL
jgi:predicted transposase/invertase (TIGR01784 family)